MHFWAMVLRLAWPRFNQSFKIIISNVQIISSIPSTTGIEFPEAFMFFMTIWQSLADMDVISIPGAACIFGRDFFRR